MKDASWSYEELHNGFLPDDFHHLWSILCMNPEKRVKMSSVKKDLKMIRNILPEEINLIYFEVYKILNGEQYSNYDLYSYNYLYKFMALNYLKYGLAGIKVKNEKCCINCGEDIKNKTSCCISDTTIKGHKIKCYYSSNFIVVNCENCGLHRKFDNATNDDIGLFGPCCTNKKKHIFHNCRNLYCPIEEHEEY